MKKNYIILLLVIILGIAFTGQVSSQTTFGPLTEPFLKMIADGPVHIKDTYFNKNGSTSDSEVYIKDGKSALVLKDTFPMRMVIRDKKTYLILEPLKEINITDSTSIAVGIEYDIDNLTFTGSGESVFNGQNLPYEEYLHTAGYIVQYFVNGNKLAGFRSKSPEKGEMSGDSVITVMDQRIPNSAFNVPTRGYTITDNTQ
jgi:hypothetical protein